MGRHAEYTHADTWYPSWASDDKLYSPFADGEVNDIGVQSISSAEIQTLYKGVTNIPHVGHATILGDDPMKLKIVDQGKMKVGIRAPMAAATPAAHWSTTACGTTAHIAWMDG